MTFKSSTPGILGMDATRVDRDSESESVPTCIGLTAVHIVPRSATPDTQGWGLPIAIKNVFNRSIEGDVTVSRITDGAVLLENEPVTIPAGEEAVVTALMGDPGVGGVSMWFRFEGDAGRAVWEEMVQAAVIAQRVNHFNGNRVAAVYGRLANQRNTTTRLDPSGLGRRQPVRGRRDPRRSPRSAIEAK